MEQTTGTATYRKTKQGQWVAFGPASVIRVGQVTVAKRDGTTKTETVESVGRTFTVDGVDCCYGYLAAKPVAHRTTRTERTYASVLDCGHRSDRPRAGCFDCSHQIGL